MPICFIEYAMMFTDLVHAVKSELENEIPHGLSSQHKG